MKYFTTLIVLIAALFALITPATSAHADSNEVFTVYMPMMAQDLNNQPNDAMILSSVDMVTEDGSIIYEVMLQQDDGYAFLLELKAHDSNPSCEVGIGAATIAHDTMIVRQGTCKFSATILYDSDALGFYVDAVLLDGDFQNDWLTHMPLELQDAVKAHGMMIAHNYPA